MAVQGYEAPLRALERRVYPRGGGWHEGGHPARFPRELVSVLRSLDLGEVSHDVENSFGLPPHLLRLAAREPADLQARVDDPDPVALKLVDYVETHAAARDAQLLLVVNQRDV